MARCFFNSIEFWPCIWSLSSLLGRKGSGNNMQTEQLTKWILRYNLKTEYFQYFSAQIAPREFGDGEFTYRRIGHTASHMLVRNPATSSNQLIPKIRVIFAISLRAIRHAGPPEPKIY